MIRDNVNRNVNLILYDIYQIVNYYLNIIIDLTDITY